MSAFTSRLSTRYNDRMPDTQSILTADLPKAVRVVGIPFAAIFLTLFFVVIGFPYHHLTDRAEKMVGGILGVEIDAADSGLTVTLRGPGFRFSDINIETPVGDIYPVDTMRFGPAWSFSWFSLVPTIFFDVDSPIGQAEGTLGISDGANGEGTITDAALSKLPFLAAMLPFATSGTLSATASIQTIDGALDGPVAFDLVDGEFKHESLPLELAYDTLHGEITFGGEHWLNLDTVELLGPMLNLTIKGTIGHPVKNQDRPLDLAVQVSDVLGPMRSPIESLGVKLDSKGAGKAHIGGTTSAPVFK